MHTFVAEGMNFAKMRNMEQLKTYIKDFQNTIRHLQIKSELQQLF